MEKQIIDTQIERLSITGMIVSSDFLEGIIPIYSRELLTVPYIKTVAKWCVDYWEQYKKAPGIHIQDIFSSQSRSDLDEDQSELIGEFLGSISDEYERSDKFNVEYVLDQTEKYFKSRSLEIIKEDISALLASGKVKEAEEAVNLYKPLERPSSSGVEPLSDKELIYRAFELSEEDALFRFPGALGNFIGQLERDMFIAIQAPEKRGKCITGDSLVLLADGRLKPMKSVVEDMNSNPVSLNEDTMQFVEGKAIQYIKNGKKRCFKVSTRTGREIEATGIHPLLTPSGWKEVKNLKVGCYIAVSKKIPFFGRKTLPDHKLKLLGYLIADGGLRKQYSVGFTNIHEETQADFIKQVHLIGDSVTKKGIEITVKNNLLVKGKHNQNKTRQFMIDMGLWDKLSKEKELPDIVFQLEKNRLVKFLRALFSCDCEVSASDIIYSSASKKLVYQIFHLLQRFGIVSRIEYGEKTNSDNSNKFLYWKLMIRDTLNISLFMKVIGFDFYKQGKAKELLKKKIAKKSFLDISPYEVNLRIHHELLFHADCNETSIYKLLGNRLYETFMASIRDKKNLMRCTTEKIYQKVLISSLQRLINPEILWDRIDSIEDIGFKETFDLAVEDTHNFVAGDIVVHNTYWLLEFAMRALRSKCNVAFFSVGDMSEIQMVRRIHSYNSQLPIQDISKVKIPILDCSRNQENTCKMEERTCDFGVITRQGKKAIKIDLDDAPDYEPCTYCQYSDPERYKGVVWHIWRDVEKLTWRHAYNQGKKTAHRARRRRFKLSTHSNNSVNVRGIKTQLDLWEKIEGFIPDVILIDYADILAPENNKWDFRQQVNTTWQELRALSQDRHCLVATATQADAASYDKKSIGMKNFSEDKRKYSHVNMILTLNQTEDEKQDGIMRIGKMFVRENSFSIHKTVTVLECRAIGRPYLASF